MISLKAEDVLQLPPVIYSNVMVDLSKKEMADYRRFEREMALEEHDIEAVNRGVLTFKLLQYANGHVYRTDETVHPPKREAIRFHDAKLDALDSVVAELNGANLLVAYTFKFDLAAIRKRYPKARLATDEGVLDDWNAGKVQMLLAHPASIGHGMNIQFGGHNIVWFGLTPSLELYQQFNARLPRPGQTAERVFVRHILARGTFDERLIGILGDRDATQDRITDAVRWRLSAALV
jgi:SNF2 family DNA or RNA helicase